jgi:hypothetical protein
MIHCTKCDAEIPAGGSFCVECGAPAPQAATGATERLAERQGGPICSACGTRNPPGADFCVTCGRPLGARPFAKPSPPPAFASPAPIAAEVVPAAPHALPPASTRRFNRPMWGGVSGGLFLIGLAVLAITGWWWPGILVLLGITSLAGSLVAGQPLWMGLQGSFWMFGIAVLAITGWWWPGILILAGLSAILGTLTRPRFR